MEHHGFQHKKNITDRPVAEIIRHQGRLTIKKTSIQFLRLTTTTNYESHSDDDDWALFDLPMNIFSHNNVDPIKPKT